MRNAVATTLYSIAKEDSCIVVLVADISPAGAMEDFRREFPDRFYNLGVCEQSMIGLAAGLAQRGMKPFCYTIATFAIFRAYEFIRCDLAYQNLPVTVIGMGAGLSYSTLGGTHQAVEDVAVAAACPNMTVLTPSDPTETRASVLWCAARWGGGPVYLRIGKAGEPAIDYDGPWRVDELHWVRREDPMYRHRRVCVISYGPIAAEAQALADRIDADFATVPAVRPLPQGARDALAEYKRLVVVEEASGGPLAAEINAGLEFGAPARSLCLPRQFAHFNGTRDELLDYAGLTVDKMMRVLGRDAEVGT